MPWPYFSSRPRLATAGQSGSPIRMRTRQPAEALAVRNTAASFMSETVAVTRLGDSLAYLWSWGQRITDASDPGAAAHAIAYVLEARGAGLGQVRT
jgi:hypothetical protein